MKIVLPQFSRNMQKLIRIKVTKAGESLPLGIRLIMCNISSLTRSARQAVEKRGGGTKYIHERNNTEYGTLIQGNKR